MTATLNATYTILIVEDDPGIAELERGRLEEAGYDSVIATTADEALEAVGNGGIDLVLLDYRLPNGTDGLDFYARVKSAGYDLPVILVTGYGNEATVIQALRFGVRDFVTKSLEYLDYLPEAIERVLRQVGTERRLAESEARLAGIIESAKDAVIVVEADRTVSLFNPAAETMFAWPANLAIGRPVTDFIPDEYASTPEGRPDAEAVTLSHRLRTGTEGVRRGGERFPLEATVARAKLGPNKFYTLVVRDITERRRAEEALRRSESLLRKAEAMAHIAGWTYDLATDLYTSSEEGARISGMDHRPHRSEDLGASVHPDDRAGVESALRRARAGEPLQFEHRLVVDGRIKWVDVRAEPEFDAAGRVVRIMGVTQDITERRLLEDQFRQSQKMDAFGQLAGGVAHDFNNLLTVINGYSDMLLTGVGDESGRREAIVAVRDAGDRAAGLTAQLLAFSRRAILEPKILDPNAVVDETAKLLGRLIGEDVVLAISLAPSASRVRVDRGQLGQILMNLAVNARDAMPGGGHLTIATRDVVLDEDRSSLRPGVEPGRYVLVEVSDTGTGMTPDVLARIFEPFFTTKAPGKGTGLGLATTYGIVKQSGGHVEVDSRVGRGTTFRIFLPAVEGLVTGTEFEPMQILGGTESVFLVEDQEDVRKFATIALQSFGYDVESAEDGAGALRAMEGRPPPDILVTDLVMPGMGGREVADEFRARYPGLKVLFLSGYTDDAVIHCGLADTTDTFLQKPFTPIALARKIREILDRKSQ